MEPRIVTSPTATPAFTPAQVRLLKGARWCEGLHEWIPGVLAPVDLARTRSGRAAILRAGVSPREIVAGRAALWLWVGGPAVPFVDVAVRLHDRHGATKHLRVVPKHYEIDTSRWGLAVASPRQIVLDAALEHTGLPLEEAVRRLGGVGGTPDQALALAALTSRRRGLPAARARLRRLGSQGALRGEYPVDASNRRQQGVEVASLGHLEAETRDCHPIP